MSASYNPNSLQARIEVAIAKLWPDWEAIARITGAPYHQIRDAWERLEASVEPAERIGGPIMGRTAPRNEDRLRFEVKRLIFDTAYPELPSVKAQRLRAATDEVDRYTAAHPSKPSRAKPPAGRAHERWSA